MAAFRLCAASAAASNCCCFSSGAAARPSWTVPPPGNGRASLLPRRGGSRGRRGSSRQASGVARAEAAQPRLDDLSGVVTDAAVPEGHKGLHGFLYGDGDAEVHGTAESSSPGLAFRAGEDDGTAVLGFEEYVAARESSVAKLSGVYAVYDARQRVQYVGYSRNVVLSLKTHRARAGAERCAAVRVQLFTGAALVSRAHLEEERQRWLDTEEGGPPPGNAAERHLWERSGANAARAAMTDEERDEYEEKKLKLRKAMGENLYDEVRGEDEDSRTRRLKLLAATEGDDWSGVIDGQTRETVEEEEVPVAAPVVSPFADSKSGGLYSADVYDMSVENVDLVLNDVRPYLISDGGNVEVASVQDGVVSLRLQGACGTCPSSTTTMKMGIERVLTEKFGDALKGVVQVDPQQFGATVAGVNAHLEMLRPAIHNYGGFVEVISVDSSHGVVVVKYKGPAPIGMGIKAAIKDKFPDMKEVLLVGQDHLAPV